MTSLCESYLVPFLFELPIVFVLFEPSTLGAEEGTAW
jgi:hypothetical protein